jgi:hypothetical protein
MGKPFSNLSFTDVRRYARRKILINSVQDMLSTSRNQDMVLKKFVFMYPGF